MGIRQPGLPAPIPGKAGTDVPLIAAWKDQPPSHIEKMSIPHLYFQV